MTVVESRVIVTYWLIVSVTSASEELGSAEPAELDDAVTVPLSYLLKGMAWAAAAIKANWANFIVGWLST